MLKYIGNGDWLPGVPARDLTEEEVEELAMGGSETDRSKTDHNARTYSVEELVVSGLYEEGGSRPITAPARTDPPAQWKAKKPVPQRRSQ